MSLPVHSLSGRGEKPDDDALPEGAARRRSRPEILAPAGDRDCLRAAIENGADAVYFGLACGFNARARAANFEIAELPGVLAELHRRGVKGYITLNTLAFTDELPGLESLIRNIAEAGADAVLVQDLGVARLVQAICPELPIHASTQMTLTSAECIAAVKELGVARVVLPRELSVDEIAAIRREAGVELEAFVHGALCIAYSGQCLTSESLGGRSANRGQCAQACRLPYELVCDGQDVDLGAMKYLLSPQDLAAYALSGELLDAGVSCFKIEGRLKTPEYVANITRRYREAAEAAARGEPVEFSPEAVREMELSFSRGFSPGWLEGCDHKRLVPGLSSSKRGVLLGEVVAVRGGRVAVRVSGPVARGDGVVFEGDRAAGDEQGGRVFRIWRGGRDVPAPVSSGVVELEFGRQALDLNRVPPGARVWQTDDPRLTARLRDTFTAPDPQRRIPVDVEVHAAVGAPLRVSARTSSGLEAAASAADPLQPAHKHPATEAFFREQFGRLGASPFELRTLRAEIVGGPMVPLSTTSRVRQALLAELIARSEAPLPRRLAPDGALARLLALDAAAAPPAAPSLAPPVLRPLCRTLAQFTRLAEQGERELYLDFADIRQYAEAVDRGRSTGAAVWPATPRIFKPGEQGVLKLMARAAPAGVLVRNLASLAFFRAQDIPCIADYTLNAANELTVAWLARQGAARVTASYDLNREQLLALAGAAPAGTLEIVIHQHMPLFHMEHCVFCAVLSPGTNKTNCGRPCDRHEVRLRDRVGAEHPLTADVGCRNTLYNALPQSAAEAVPQLLARGVREFRVEFLEADGEDLSTTLALYRDLLAGRIAGAEVWRMLRAINRVGVTRGTLEASRDPLAVL